MLKVLVASAGGSAMSPASMVPVFDHAPNPLVLPYWTCICTSLSASGTSKLCACTLPRVVVRLSAQFSPACRQRNFALSIAGAPVGTLPAAQVASICSESVLVADGVGPLSGDCNDVA